MKKMLVALLVMLSSVFGVLGTVGVIQGTDDTAEARQTIAEIEPAYSATADITEVQKRLKKWGYYTGNVDGINGPLTISAVKRFQKKYGLTQDGIVGPLTAAKMGISLNSSSGSSGYSSNDRYLLAKVIYAEARGESYTGQVAIGAVVLNRVEDSRFPNTIAGVIYQPWAFTAVNDGQINL